MSAIPSPVSGIRVVTRISAVLLCCRLLLSYAHCEFVGCCWGGGCLLCAVLYYCCPTYCCCTAVVRGSWVDRFVGVSMGSWVFFFCYFHFPLYRPRASIVQRTTSSHFNCDVAEVVRERRRLSPLEWEAASLLWGHIFCINPWRTVGSLVEAIVGKPI